MLRAAAMLGTSASARSGSICSQAANALEHEGHARRRHTLQRGGHLGGMVDLRRELAGGLVENALQRCRPSLQAAAPTAARAPASVRCRRPRLSHEAASREAGDGLGSSTLQTQS
jgi:hypothetical protein